MNKKNASHSNHSKQFLNNRHFRGPWRLDIIKNTRKDDQQNQITTTYINNIQN